MDGEPFPCVCVCARARACVCVVRRGRRQLAGQGVPLLRALHEAGFVHRDIKVRARTHTHAHTRARARAHTHTHHEAGLVRRDVGARPSRCGPYVVSEQ